MESSSMAAVHARLAAVVEALVLAAVAELKKLVEARLAPEFSVRTGAGEEALLSDKRPADAWETMVQFAAIMETLGNEALGKMMNIVDEAELVVELASQSRRPQTSFLNVLRNAHVDVEHSYGARAEGSDSSRCSQEEQEEARGEDSGFVMAVSLKDEDGNIDLGAIAERARVDAEEPATSDLQAGGSTPGVVLQRVASGCFTCAACGKSFTAERNLKAHDCSRASETPSGRERQRQSHVHGGARPYQCQQCGKCFSKQTQLKTHAIIHTGEKPYGCEVCGRRFNLRQNLNRHAHVHTGEKVFVCCVCGKGFTRAVTLKTHKLIHTGQKPFQCDQCPKTFRHAVNLKNHSRIHSGVRPFSCDLCAKSFRQAVNLKIHQRTHTGERPFSCQQCGKTFSQQSSLMSHQRTHSEERPFSCTFCKKTFNNANSLKLHLRVHTGEKPYACDVCAKTFSQGSHLRTHKRHVHAGGKQYICDRCGKRYSDQRNLKLHKCSYA